MMGKASRMTDTKLETFKQEARSWLKENVPESLFGTRLGRFDGYWGGKKNPEDDPDILHYRDIMLERGWTAPNWPKKYGGGGLSQQETEALDEVMADLSLPPALVGFGLTMIGPTLLDYGTEEQKEQHLPPIVRGEIRWCQGYSEPNAGSDLASLQTRAVLEGDEFVVNGQKVWTSHADKSDWIFALVRTNPDVKKQRGITFVLIDMESEGVSTQPIKLISGASPFCETFFDDVRVPLDQVVGEIDKGWTVAKALLGYERTMIGSAISGQMKNSEQDLVDLARRALDCDDGPLSDQVLRDKIARFGMQNECLNLTRLRVDQAREEGQSPGAESSILKISGTELKKERFSLGMDIAGHEGLGWDGDSYDDADLQHTRDYLRSRANTIEGGTSEIQLNVIAKRVLDLPSK
jgi:acyl-CoA dehydrogenase